ncbi:ABC transporter substrate-binding protein [Ectothiorhodospira lacustris]|uniref:ABC transporter substrate-binding protein n=1 Tax=Ectothiorhodospira lacustris TaxID=2899127 RepID=UPI001EE7A4B4|nr:ABC transporter substrate-binding protein [Ectothiorhodospira lacustris]MCG5502240.1 ABC transporter substrate-binding protein [Ectothiorhodospira lacustris]
MALAFTASFSMLSPLGASAEEHHIRLGYLPVTGHAKFFVAQEQGFFAQEGLKVDLHEFANSADGIAAVVAGRLDAGAFGTSAPLIHFARGADLKVIAGVMGEDAYLITRRELTGQISGIKDLAGRKVATVRLASGDAILRYELHRAGVDWRKDLTIYELRNPPAVIQAVRTGQADAGVVWGPHDQRAQAEGLVVVLSSAALQPGHPCCRLVVSGSSLEKTEQWQALLRALLRAERFAARNHDQTVANIRKYIPLDDELIRSTYYRDTLDQSTDPNVSGVSDFWDAVTGAGFVESERDIHDVFALSFYQSALEQLAAAEPDEPLWRELLEKLALQEAS